MLAFSFYAAAWLSAAPPVTVLARLGDDEVLTVRYCNLPEGSNLRGGARAIAPISVAHSGIDLTSSPLGDCAYLRHDLGAITNRRVRDIAPDVTAELAELRLIWDGRLRSEHSATQNHWQRCFAHGSTAS